MGTNAQIVNIVEKWDWGAMFSFFSLNGGIKSDKDSFSWWGGENNHGTLECGGLPIPFISLFLT